MNRFWDLMEKSTLVSGLIALVMVATACYCVVQELTLPEYYQLMLGVIVGYFFSEKVRGAKASRFSEAPQQATWRKAYDDEEKRRLARELEKAQNVHQAVKREQRDRG